MKLHFITYSGYFNKALHGTIDAGLGGDEELKYVYKLECLYEWWETEQYEILNKC